MQSCFIAHGRLVQALRLLKLMSWQTSGLDIRLGRKRRQTHFYRSPPRRRRASHARIGLPWHHEREWRAEYSGEAGRDRRALEGIRRVSKGPSNLQDATRWRRLPDYPRMRLERCLDPKRLGRVHVGLV